MWTHISLKPWTLLHWDEHHSGAWRAGGFCHWDFTSSVPSGQWHGQKDEGKELPGALSLAKSSSHVPPAQIFSSGLETGVLLEATRPWQRQGPANVQASRLRVKISPYSPHLPLLSGHHHGPREVKKALWIRQLQEAECARSQVKVLMLIILMPFQYF